MVVMDGWDIAILAVASYVAVITLVRLMRQRHEGLIGRLREQFSAEQRRRREQQRQAKRQAMREQQAQKTSDAA